MTVINVLLTVLKRPFYVESDMLYLPIVEVDTVMDDDLLTLKDAQKFLGIGEKTLLKMLQEESVPARRLGREWRFSKKALLEWIGSGNSKDYVRKQEDEIDESTD